MGKISGEEGWISLGPWGGKGGGYTTYKPDGPIMQITIRSGDVIDSILFESKSRNGFVIGSSVKIGGAGGGNLSKFFIDTSVEQFSSISLTYKDYRGYAVLTSLWFDTNLKRYGPYGRGGGHLVSTPIEGGVIAGFHGRGGSYLDAIGVFVAPKVKKMEEELKTKIEELETKNKELKKKEDVIQTKMQEVEALDKELKRTIKMMQVTQKTEEEMKTKMEELKAKNKEMKEREDVFQLKMEAVEAQNKELRERIKLMEVTQKKMEEELETKNKELNEREDVLQMKIEEVEAQNKELRERIKLMEVTQKKMEEELETKNKELKEREDVLQTKIEEVEAHNIELREKIKEIVTQGNISGEEGLISLGIQGGKEGAYWAYKTDGPTMQICVRYGQVIDSILFKCKRCDGVGRSVKIGGSGGYTTVMFCIDSSVEQLLSISLTYEDFRGEGTIVSLSFHTNLRTYGPFGSKTGTSSVSIPIEDGGFAGFHGRVGTYLNAIGILVTTSNHPE